MGSPTTRPTLVAWTVALFPLLFVTLLVVGKLFAPRLYQVVISEDSVVEYATFGAYLLAALFALSLAVDLHRQRRRVCFYSCTLLMAGLFVVAMEEISWGQRIFGIDTPSYLESLNRQGETSLHNLGGFPLHNAFIVVGLYGAVARWLVPGMVKRRQPMLVELWTPPYALSLYFLLPAALYAHYQYLYYRYLVPLDLEWSEFYGGSYAQAFVGGEDQEPSSCCCPLDSSCSC